MAHARKSAFDNIRSRQQRKFESILAKSQRPDRKDSTIINVNKREKDALQSKWVVNLSDHDLSPDETSLLMRGLNFAVTPSAIPMNEYVIGIESACKVLGPHTKQADVLRSDCVKILKHATPPKPNITPKEQAA